MNIKDIVKDWLRQNKYDGLCYPRINCGCRFENLMHCDAPDFNCKPGYECEKNICDGIYSE